MAHVLAPETPPELTAALSTPRGAVRFANRGAAAGALLAALGASTWLVVAAAQRPSVLAPPSLRQPHRWLLGPLSGLLPHLSTDPQRLHHDLLVALLILFAAWLVAWALAPALPVGVVGAAVSLAQLVWFLGPPQPITDTFNYIVYGRMAAHGLNPYRVLPVDAPHDSAYALANWHHLPSPYGPLFTLLSEPLGLLPTAAGFWVWKAVVVGSALALLALVAWLARRLGRSPQRALACAGLCPVVLAIGIGGFHNDAPAMLGVVGAAACLVAARGAPRNAARYEAAAGALVVAAAAVKPSFAVAVPIVVLGAARRGAALLGAAAVGAATGAVVLLAFGGALPAIGIQSRLVTPLSLPNLLGVALGHGGADAAIRAVGRDALGVIVVIAAALVAWRRRLALPALGVVLLAAALTLSWVMPWYLGWSLPFAALARPKALVPLAIAGCLWLGVGGIPQMPKIIHAVGFFPTRSATGMANHLYEKSLVR
jgi:hypothetical protein